IFIFVMTELVFVTQVASNPNVGNFLDAMYFTITTLTTTGFGDITLQGDSGRFLSIVIMIFGVSLFLRLIQTMFRPSKVRFTCTDCGLFLHENDAVHCKHCGKVLPIPSEGDV
ncbi:MAG: two pore domain potassium channel family protein, partial [Alphaproteobacteria bacterium]|nr:two pore domain potassium channel family protein [Alphaproteobacteria bacterium]